MHGELYSIDLSSDGSFSRSQCNSFLIHHDVVSLAGFGPTVGPSESDNLPFKATLFVSLPSGPRSGEESRKVAGR